MRRKHKLQEPQELAEPRKARHSGSIRVASSASAPRNNEPILRFAERLNSRLPVLPSIILEPSLLDEVLRDAARASAAKWRRRATFLVALAALMCGGLVGTLLVKQTRPTSAAAIQGKPANGFNLGGGPVRAHEE